MKDLASIGFLLAGCNWSITRKLLSWQIKERGLADFSVSTWAFKIIHSKP